MSIENVSRNIRFDQQAATKLRLILIISLCAALPEYPEENFEIIRTCMRRGIWPKVCVLYEVIPGKQVAVWNC